MDSSAHPDLTLAHHLLLLSLDPQTGGRRAIVPTSFAISALALAELAMAGRIDVVNGRVTVADPDPTGRPLLDAALSGVQNDTVRTPVRRINQLRPVLDKLAVTQLLQLGLLRAVVTEGPVPRTVLRLADPDPVRRLAEHLRGRLGADESTLALVMGVRIATLEHPVLGDDYLVVREHARELVDSGGMRSTVLLLLRAGHEARAAAGPAPAPAVG